MINQLRYVVSTESNAEPRNDFPLSLQKHKRCDAFEFADKDLISKFKGIIIRLSFFPLCKGIPSIFFYHCRISSWNNMDQLVGAKLELDAESKHVDIQTAETFIRKAHKVVAYKAKYESL